MTLRLVAAKQMFRMMCIAWPLMGVYTTANADDSQGKSSTDKDEWLVLVSPFVWAPAMNGQVALGGVDAKADVGFREIFNNLNRVFMGNLEVTNRKLGFYLDGVYAKTSQSERAYGQKIGLDITQSTLAGGVYYRVYEYALGGNNVFGEPRSWRVEPTPLRDVVPSLTRVILAPKTGPRFSCSESLSKTIAGSDLNVCVTWTR